MSGMMFDTFEGKRGRFPLPAAIFICIVPPLGAFKSRLGGTYILSLLVYTVIVSCDYASIYLYVYSPCRLIVDVFARSMRSAATFATTVLVKCVTHVGSPR